MILCNEYESFAVHLQLKLFLVSARPRVFRSGRSTATLVFTAPPSRSSKLLFLSICSFEIYGNFQHYSQITPSTRGIAHKDQHTSHLQRKSQRRNSFTATLSWSILGATWFTFVLHRASARGPYFDVTQCQYLPCGTRNHTITNTCRIYCTSIYTFIIFTVMAGWHQGNSIRFCCGKLTKF